ncbi:MAG TPA: translation elongation factor EF-1 subunit alpha [Candidatus Nanopusillus sp.]|nr:translation elongation factor EF-1 subunit alpha [Candidatus Nanopusillus sp.]
MPRQKPHLNLATIGHVDNGKSTLVGRLIYELGLIDEKILQQLRELAKELGKETFEFAYLMDKAKEERERGVTIDPTHYKIETKKYEITFIDLPGHRDFIKNMITGASQADAAILVVSARPGEAETALGPDGQGREHLLLVRTLGVQQIIVAINKMDTVNYDQKRYEEVKNMVLKLAQALGYKPEQIKAIVPVSAYYGDNVVKKSDKTPWYNGPTLYEAMDLLEEPPRLIDKPLRIPIQDVYNIKGVGVVPVGRVESGKLRPGDKVVFLPSRKPNGVVGEVKSIEMHHQQTEEAIPGDNIGFNVKGVEKRDIGRGDVVGKLGEQLPTVAEEFEARIMVLWHPSAIAPGYAPVFHIHTAHVSGKIVEIKAKLDPRTGQVAEQNPQFIKQGDAAIIKVVPTKPVVVEKFQDFPNTSLSRFAMRDMGKTVAVGQVLDVKAKKIEIKT